MLDYKIAIFFPDNEIIDSGDLVHLALIAESKLMKTKEAMGDSKWIYAK